MTKSLEIIMVMGVSGSGKTTIGKLLGQKLGLEFYDADDYHPEANIRKMASGKPLTDKDRLGWLERLNKLILEREKQGMVLGCSALKESYRHVLANAVEIDIKWVYLDGSFEEILERMKGRKDHFMPPELLRSQFETLEVPTYAIAVPIDNSPETTVAYILEKLQ
ncbi:MAG: gluconokinase [Flavobacteriaceae bacterium]